MFEPFFSLKVIDKYISVESQTAATSDGNKIVSRDENKYDQVAPEDKKDELKHDEKDINLGEVPAINKTPAQSRSIKEKQAKVNQKQKER